MTDSPRSLRDGRFVLLGPIGEGAQGRTFDGVDKREGRPVAIKRFDVRGATSWKDVELAEREARVLKDLSHKRLPSYVDHFEEDGALYLVMEKVPGESLAATRRRGDSFSEAQVWRLLHDASDVLDYLHGRAPPVIHRDLKPGNVILRPDGAFAFVDFGAVRDKLRPKGGSTVVGTFGYMAPEQMQGRALPASDVYAIGATAISMLTGCEPEDLPHRGLAIDVRTALAGRASPRLESVLERMLVPDPDQRAARLAPLLSGGAPPPWDRSYETLAFAALADRHARRAARRAARAARRARRRRSRRPRFLPFPVRLVLTLALSLAILAVLVATQVVVPLVLGVLAVVLGRPALRRAADAVKNAGHVAVDGMRNSRRWTVETDGPERESGAAPRPGPRVAPSARVADADADAHPRQGETGETGETEGEVERDSARRSIRE